MQVKKNPNVDLNRNSGLYFVIGLTMVLFLTWRALEYKSYPKNDQIVEMMNVVEELKEDVPITEQIKTPPPPPPPSAPEIIEIVEDAAEIEETVIESTESSQDQIVEEVVDVDDVEVGDEEEDISVPFAIIENVPIFPGCESAKGNAARKACFQQKIQQHIKKEFSYPQIAAEMGIQGRVFVQFAINSKGYIDGIRTRGPDPGLEKEAARIVSSLPKMTPGMQRGRAVTVPYSIPVNFKLAIQ
ncbi:energy transducer TonB [Maribacter sp. HTCC2170]|uniref:energy transducer TonB n=1 Tax=Maribacter sp. (strain HTCC2170 / KCCM 42371) TaxID=313603 RepID=UPI00006AE61D|nr:energy transducer TonB [Maribacter sp. HTCC2170]EAR00450.1 TonB [Maribacter sp. HTCC2170]